MRRSGDVRRLLHVYERHVRGDSDLSGRDMHCGTDMRRFGRHVLTQHDLSILSIVSGNANVSG